MKIYTKTGDKGQTALVSGERIDKDDQRIEAYGTVDELNSFIGLANSCLGMRDEDLKEDLTKIQHHLLDIGAELASLSDKKTARVKVPHVTEKKVTWLESSIDRYDKELTQLTQFILPGGDEVASQLHVARSVCRRAERCVITVQKSREVNSELIKYLNRLSDFLFTVARVINMRAGNGDVVWEHDKAS